MNGEVHGDTTFPCVNEKLCNENFRYDPAFSDGDIESAEDFSLNMGPDSDGAYTLT